MLLTSTELRRIEIATWRANNHATLEQTAEHFGISVSAVSSAERYFVQNRLHNLEAYQRLTECRAEKVKHLRWLERKMLAVERQCESEEKPVPMSAVAQFSREWGRTHTEVAELDGLINRVLNVNLSGSVSFVDLLVQAHDELGASRDRQSQAILN